MKSKFLIYILLSFSLQQLMIGQPATYSVTKAPFSSDKYDEFSPVYYKNGIVFCTNRNNGLTNYSTSEDKGLFKIEYIDTTGRVNWQSARLFSKALTSKLNDGPVTFSRGGDTIYYSRNLDVSSSLKEISGKRNKLGIFSAILVNGEWTKIRDLRVNNEWYNVITPCLSPDGKRLFFASDKPGGFGGFDLYYCQWKGDYWDEPVNMGPVINTSGNEGYPFMNPAGELFFSSDGHPGSGGKDIFVSRFSGKEWLTPVHLDPPINSKYDDFGIITDSLMNEGYFSSNRDKTIDIFHFKTIISQVFYTTVQKENQYCFMFSDSGSIAIDTLNLKYVWDFGDGIKTSGPVVSHCFSGPGKYNTRLDIVDKGTGKLFFSKLSYDLILKDFEQAYINSPDVSVKDETIDFDGLKSFLPGYRILSYSWDFGDGTKMEGERANHKYKEAGEYMVNLGVTLKSDSTGNIHKTGSSKKIAILDSNQEKTKFRTSGSRVKSTLPDILKYENAHINSLYSAESEFKQDAIFRVELFSSKTKTGVNSTLFRGVPKKYMVKENYDGDTGVWHYFIDQQMNLMATYYAFRELAALGFKDVHTNIEVLKDPAAKEINSLKKIFGVSTDIYFDNNSRLTSTSYLMLDQLVRIMNKYPAIKLEIAVHTDNIGSPDAKLSLSQQYAQIISGYLINKGIESKRLISRGSGGSVPIASNYLEKDRALNRRVDFTVIK